ncbi:phosphopantetheine-binding protein [Kitasatospora sp. NPDC088134]|uniref:phosphopantetheine-binding protein n=1 Tax=Kitasatospora sp. NPDC088134 TaxID=3364071 RepID=UPI003808B436
MLSTNDLLDLVRGQITDLLEEAGVEHDGITGAEPLNAIGLSSLLLARLIIQLEMETGVDPFAEGDLVLSDVRSVAELADAYAKLLGGAAVAA